MIGSFCFSPVSCHGVGSGLLEVRECTDGITNDDSTVIENLLKLVGRLGAIMLCQIRQSTDVDRIERAKEPL